MQTADQENHAGGDDRHALQDAQRAGLQAQDMLGVEGVTHQAGTDQETEEAGGTETQRHGSHLAEVGNTDRCRPST